MAIYQKQKDRRDWWNPSVRGEPHEEIATVVQSLIAEQSSRLTILQSWHAIYTDRDDPSLRARSFHREGRQQFNVVRNGIDAIHSKITKNRPAPWVVTVGGKYSLQRRAEQLTHYLEGEFTRLDVHELGSDATLDSLIYGTGLLKVYEENGRPCCERVLAREVLADPTEERHRTVRTKYQIKTMDRAQVQGMYPDADLSKAGAPPNEISGGQNPIASDLIMVVEAWHLPAVDPEEAGEGAGDDDEGAAADTCDDCGKVRCECSEERDDEISGGIRYGKKRDRRGRFSSGSATDEDDGKGWHAIIAEGATLRTEEWKRPTFPFAKLDASKDPEGYWGIGYAEMMSGIQHETNSLSDTISECFDLSVPSVWNESNAQVKREQIDDTPWRQYIYQSGASPPIFQVPQAVSEQHLIREDTLINRSYEMVGISQLGAESKKPAGLNSGKAMLVYQDIESERFVSLGRRYEKFHMDVAELLVQVTEEIASGDDSSKLEAILEDDGMLEVILYKDVRMGAKDPYRVRVTPTSALSHSPIGRLQEVDQMREMGIVTDPDTIRDLVNMPDLRAFNKREAAGRRIADRMIEKALDGNRATANQYMPLPYAHRQAVLALCEAELDDAPEKALQMLRDFVGHVEALMNPPAPPMPPPGPPPAMGPPPMGPPGMPPGAMGPPGPPMGPPMLPPGPMPGG